MTWSVVASSPSPFLAFFFFLKDSSINLSIAPCRITASPGWRMLAPWLDGEVSIAVAAPLRAQTVDRLCWVNSRQQPWTLVAKMEPFTFADMIVYIGLRWIGDSCRVYRYMYLYIYTLYITTSIYKRINNYPVCGYVTILIQAGSCVLSLKCSSHEQLSTRANYKKNKNKKKDLQLVC